MDPNGWLRQRPRNHGLLRGRDGVETAEGPIGECLVQDAAGVYISKELLGLRLTLNLISLHRAGELGWPEGSCKESLLSVAPPEEPEEDRRYEPVSGRCSTWRPGRGTGGPEKNGIYLGFTEARSFGKDHRPELPCNRPRRTAPTFKLTL